MIFDSKIKVGYEPISCFNSDIAMQHKGEPGYLSSDITAFRNISEGVKTGSIVLDIFSGIDNEGFFKRHGDDTCFQYFLPFKWRKGNLRPFTVEEFLERYPVGTEFRTISVHSYIERSWIVKGVYEDKDGPYIMLKRIMINEGRFITLRTLCEQECIVTGKEVLPIGIEEME